MPGAEKKRQRTRRTFLKEISTFGAALAATGAANFAESPFSARQTEASYAGVPKRIGLGLYTVRDLMTDGPSYQTTLSKVAEIGYKEVEPADRTDSKVAYGGLGPKAFRALRNQNGLTMPSTHSSAIDGPGLEAQLEGFQIMGIKYTEVIQPSSPHAGEPGSALPVTGRGGAGGSAPPAPPSRARDAVKRMIDEINRHAQITKRFGIKILVRMDIDMFVPLSDEPDLLPYQMIADNTDPSLVTMQIDTGWAAIAGQDIVGMFKRNPGHYELWHVKDAIGLGRMTPQMSFSDRRRTSYFVPVGLGEVDLHEIFASAPVAGLKHIGIEQDNAASWGDSLAAARVNYENVMKLIS